ncbi:hypothetical protein LTR56_017502 [Elasticomyces elasticus]|nr:hypothetical protein LTR56_017502 [Elasticomyces elasticus]KAK3665097.1 hypothetical protein LTR22_004153 [Elasticomyces elasticus]KAK4931527.1 hypothetical protein LTR49_001915 [Elasticomyces elasticus]KAK5766686.1 hypothetical protein LTS12_003035 [Elasticomyces elasticus]
MDTVGAPSSAVKRGHSPNHIVDMFIKGSEKSWPLPDHSTIKLAFELLLASSRLCMFLAHEAAWYRNEEATKDMPPFQDLPSECLGLILQRMIMSARNTGNFIPEWRGSMCRYHEHASEDEKSACEKANLQLQQEMKAKNDKGTYHETIAQAL